MIAYEIAEALGVAVRGEEREQEVVKHVHLP